MGSFLRGARIALLSLLLLGPVRGAAQAPAPDALAKLEREIAAAHDEARSDPTGIAAHLEERRARFDGKLLRTPGQPALQTGEGVAAVDEAIAFLEAAKPLPALNTSRGLTLAARDHVRDLGPRGGTGHRGSDGSQVSDRADRHGRWTGVIAENISYGPPIGPLPSGREIVARHIVDDGVPGRGHRTNIFNPRFQAIGVACGPHETMRLVCVVVYASRFQDSTTER